MTLKTHTIPDKLWGKLMFLTVFFCKNNMSFSELQLTKAGNQKLFIMCVGLYHNKFCSKWPGISSQESLN